MFVYIHVHVFYDKYIHTHIYCIYKCLCRYECKLLYSKYNSYENLTIFNGCDDKSDNSIDIFIKFDKNIYLYDTQYSVLLWIIYIAWIIYNLQIYKWFHH